jgi:toxin-antitoxin system PIN domain toxin
MIAVDTNLLVYSHRSDSPFHLAAKESIETLRSQPAPWAIPWSCVHEFVAIVTHARVFRTPTPLEVCFACVDGWLAGGNLHLIGEGDAYLAKLRELAFAAQLKGPRIHDARIAAVCLHHGVSELWSADRDFSAFPQLKVRNPLIKAG